ncbi:tetratricopeptide repeat protein [bacterium]|nr:tetratricopeptide repeat protein [bacterium]
MMTQVDDAANNLAARLSSNQRRTPTTFYVGLGAVLLLTVGVYLPIFSQELTTWDDGVYITTNPYVLGGLTVKGASWAFQTFNQANYHPLTWISLMVDAELFGQQAWGYKLTNLSLHLTSTALIAWILWFSTERVWASNFVAALFALHPIHVESVAWVSERKDTLSTTFVLAAMACYVLYARRTSPGWYIGFLGWYVLSLLSKQMYVTLPALLLVLDFWPFRRVSLGDKSIVATSSIFPARPFASILAEKIPPLGLAMLFAFLIFRLQSLDNSAQHATFPVSERLGNAVVSYTLYLEKTFLPINFSFFYPFPSEGYPSREVMIRGGILVSVTLLAIGLARRAPFVLVGWLWYLGTLLPVIGLVQVGFQAYADRYVYFPLIGIFIAVVWLLDWVAMRRPQEGVMIALMGGVVLLALSTASYFQVTTWQNSKTMATHALVLDPKNHQANSVMGFDAFSNYQWDDAEKFFAKAVQTPNGPGTHHLNYGIVLLCQGRVKEARQEFETTLTLLPRETNSRFQLGLLSAAEDQLPVAIKLLTESYELDPAPLTALSLAVVHARAGDLEKAQQVMKTVPNGSPEVRLAGDLIDQMAKGNADAKTRFDRLFHWPATVQASRLRASNVELSVRQGKLTPEEGIKHLRKALDLWPRNTDALFQLAILLGRTKRTAEAKSLLNEILEWDPKHEGVRELLGGRGSGRR